MKGAVSTNDPQLFASVGVVVLSIAAIISFAVQIMIIFYIAAALAILSGFYLAGLLSKEANQAVEQKRSKR